MYVMGLWLKYTLVYILYCTLYDKIKKKLGGPFTKTVSLQYGRETHKATGELCTSS